MKNEEFKLMTTVSGNTFKFNNIPKNDLLIDFPNKVIIGISSSISCIDCYLPDEHQIYHYAGDLNFKNNDDIYYLNIHSRAISALIFNEAKVPIPDSNSNLCNVRVELKTDKSKQWFESIKDRF